MRAESNRGGKLWNDAKNTISTLCRTCECSPICKEQHLCPTQKEAEMPEPKHQTTTSIIATKPGSKLSTRNTSSSSATLSSTATAGATWSFPQHLQQVLLFALRRYVGHFSEDIAVPWAARGRARSTGRALDDIPKGRKHDSPQTTKCRRTLGAADCQIQRITNNTCN